MKRDRTHDAPRSGVRIPNSLLALGSAAVLAVYSAGNLRTREAAQRFDNESGARRRPMSPGDAGGDRADERSAGLSSTSEQGGPRADSGAALGALPTESGADRAAASVISPATHGVVTAASSPAAGAVTVAGSKEESANVVSVPATAVSTAAATTAAPSKAVSSDAALTNAASSVASPQSAAAASTNGSAPTAPTSAPKAVAGLPTAAVATTSDSTKPATDSVKAMWRDGTFSGWGTSRHGDIEATVVIEGGKITGASISRCLTRYSCSWIAHLQQQVVTRQSPEVDYVSGATQSANAFYYAVVDALQKAK